VIAPDKREGGAPPAPPAPAHAAASEPSEAAIGQPGQPDPLVSVAFVLGWQVAEVYRPDPSEGAAPLVSENDLPGLSRLSPEEWTNMGLDRVLAGIAKLSGPISDAGLEAPDAHQFVATVRATTDGNARMQAIRDFHIDLLATLTAADYRLGKAYQLGRALADTTRPPADYRAELVPDRVAAITGWIRELASALPPHAAHPVADSLDAWSRWAHPKQPRAEVDPAVLAKLGAQGRLWRSLLSGEKRPTDTLETSDYMRAGESLVRRSAALGGRFLKHFWWLVILIPAFFIGGIVVVAISSTPTAVVGGVASIVVALGLGYNGVGGALGRAIGRVEQPLWSAEIDTVIYERITPQIIVDSQRAFRQGPDEPSLTAP